VPAKGIEEPAVRRSHGWRPAEDDAIDARQTDPVLPKAFANDPLQPVAVDGSGGAFSPDGQSQPGCPRAIAPREHSEKGVYRAEGVRKDLSVLSWTA